MPEESQAHSRLTSAQQNDKDEFYTQYDTIESELLDYTEHLAGKTVYCNCDFYKISNFFKYFLVNFNKLKLKTLICTNYSASIDTKPYKAIISKVEDKIFSSGDIDFNTLFEIDGNSLSVLSGSGSFDSKECIELLKEADVISTNPPFSLFKIYLSLLLGYKKDFIILGPLLGVGYRDIFPLFRDNKLHLGNSVTNGHIKFEVHKEYNLVADRAIIEEDKKFIWVKGVRWFTTFEIEIRKHLKISERYTPEKYPLLDNFNAINVDSTNRIPIDYFPCWYDCPFSDRCSFKNKKETVTKISDSYQYSLFEEDKEKYPCDSEKFKETFKLPQRTQCNGVIAAPLTVIDKYNPAEYEILGTSSENNSIFRTKLYSNNKVSEGALKTEEGLKSLFRRIFIRLTKDFIKKLN